MTENKFKYIKCPNIMYPVCCPSIEEIISRRIYKLVCYDEPTLSQLEKITIGLKLGIIHILPM